MVVRRRRKVRKLRGRTRSMSWGRVGQHRGPGSHGGHGAAGMHKHRWMWVIKYAPTWFGKHGFNKPFIRDYKVEVVNVGELDENAELLVKQGLAEKENDAYKIDITRLGAQKLAGRGKVTRKLVVIAPKATSNAIEKIEAAGGKVVLPEEQS
ncbi:MAG: 50S ribosomal protein L15 [Desulfurococcales archaeon]|nr:50S ribosomal protein L15 [Desulfurococcales archaeon]